MLTWTTGDRLLVTICAGCFLMRVVAFIDFVWCPGIFISKHLGRFSLRACARPPLAER